MGVQLTVSVHPAQACGGTNGVRSPSCRTIFMTTALREELKQWLERLKREEALDPERYRNSGMLLRLPNGLAVEPVLIRKKFLKWQDADALKK